MRGRMGYEPRELYAVRWGEARLLFGCEITGGRGGRFGAVGALQT